MTAQATTEIDMPGKSRFNYPPLQAQPLRELVTLITSGIPLADAWAKATTMAHPAGPVILQQLQKGSSLPAAMKCLELISAPQQLTLSAANNAGRLCPALQQLAADYENREAHQRKLKSKFYLLYLLLFVGWGASLALVAAQGQGLLAAFVSNTLWCLICYAIIHKTVSIVLKDGWWWLDKAWRFGMQQHKAYQWALIAHWYALLGTQVAAGVDLVSALRQMAVLLNQASYRKAIKAASNDLENGHPLSQSLADCSLLPNPAFRSILISAEASGRLAETLEQQRHIAEQQLARFQDTVMMWVPKGLYAMCGAVALAMVL